MKKEKLYLGLISILSILVTALLIVNFCRHGDVANRLISFFSNKPTLDEVDHENDGKSELCLKIDGEYIKFKNSRLHVSGDAIMFPAKEISNVFRCAINNISEAGIELQKGNQIVQIKTDTSVVISGGNTYFLEKPVEYYEKELYVNTQLFEMCFDYKYNYNESANCLEMVDTRKNENILPSRYSYREVGRMPEIKNQGAYSTCWAFSSTFALESSILPYRNIVFSEDHMIWNNGLITSYKTGGEYTRAMAYLLAWKGPVDAADDEYGDFVTNENAVAAHKVQEIQIIESKNIEAIKRAVFLTGGVDTSLYTSMTYLNEDSMYYNSDNNSYCYIGTKRPNHEVVIVGWDDNYPKENFSESVPADGAFICANSWGTDFGDNGLFYVSYYDSNIGITNILYSGIDFDGVYDRIYQSDYCGWVGQMGFEEDSAYFANVYSATENEQLEAAGFYATGKDTSYEVYVVNNFSGTQDFRKMKMVAEGRLTNAGYYTIDFDEGIALSAGEKYAVVVKICTPGTVHPIAIEYQAGYSTRNVDITDGDGYISLYGNTWENVESTKSCNVCLKAYTTIMENEE